MMPEVENELFYENYTKCHHECDTIFYWEEYADSLDDDGEYISMYNFNQMEAYVMGWEADNPLISPDEVMAGTELV